MAETLQEFLVKLKYQAEGRESFLAGIKGAGSSVMRLGKALVMGGTALGVFFGKYAARMEQVEFVARRTGSQVKELMALDQTGASLGSSVEGAKDALESLAKFMNTTPGASNWLSAIGVQTKDAKGHALSTVRVMENLGKSFRKMPVWNAAKFAETVGIGYNMMLAMREKRFSGYIDKFEKPLNGSHLDETAKVSNDAMIAGRVFSMKKEAIESRVALPVLKAFVASDAKTQGLSTDLMGLAKALGEVSVGALLFKGILKTMFGASVAEGVAGKAGAGLRPLMGRLGIYGATAYMGYEAGKALDKIPLVHEISGEVAKSVQKELKSFAHTPILGTALRKMDLIPSDIDIVRAKTVNPPPSASRMISNHYQDVHVVVNIHGVKDASETARKVKEELRMAVHNSSMATH
ncbi:MAG: hypothetical protein VST70_01685 [Nitrospirota bacterium]|nr:hypothetical protein [Nitrospirota bacterium]